jgi:hypothetical protein
MAFLTQPPYDNIPVDRLMYLTLVLLLVGWIVWKVVGNLKFNAKYRLPNVVPGLPLIGNVHQLPREAACLHFEKLAKQYGEV